MLDHASKPRNEGPFNELRQSLVAGCTDHEFRQGLVKVSPTPAQLYRILEVSLLAPGTLPSRLERLQTTGEFIATLLREVPISPASTELNLQLVDAYKNVAAIVSYCQDNIERLATNRNGTGDCSADEINAYLFAKLQDELRWTLMEKGFAFEARDEFSDPAPAMLERSREDFLEGYGTYRVRPLWVNPHRS